MSQRKTDENYSRLRFALKKIYDSEVTLESDHPSKRKLLMFFLGKFKEFCQNRSPEFKSLFKEFYFTGSYFEGLRVSEATEFDVNVVFSLWPSDLNYKIDELDSPLPYATCQLKCPSAIHQESVISKSFFDDQKYLVGNAVRKWFQSLVDSFINNTNLSFPGLQETTTTHSGPARTVKVFYKQVWISIDLVPVFKIDVQYLHKYTLTHAANVTEDSLAKCFLVPKPLKVELSALLPSELVERAWRIHFAETEKQIMKGKTILKPLIKLMKCLRDKEQWPIPSYFIKVAAFWLVSKHPNLQVWNQSSYGFMFLKFLEALEKHFTDRCLNHILYPSFNLLHSLRPRALMNLKKRIRSIILDLKKHPKHAYNLFKVPMLAHPLR